MSLALNRQNQYDNVYYNVKIKSDNTKSRTYPEVDVVRTENILDRASDYYVSVIRFNIPSFFVPVLKFVPNQYSISFIYLQQSGGADINPIRYQQTLAYDNRNQNIPDDDTANPEFYYIYNFAQMVDIVNQALGELWGAVIADYPDLETGNDFPFIAYNNQTSSFTLWFTEPAFGLNRPDDPNTGEEYLGFVDPESPNKVQVWFSFELYTLFQSFPFIINQTPSTLPSDTGDDIQLEIATFRINLSYDPDPTIEPDESDVWIQLNQEYSSIYNWNPFKKIVITSNSLPIVSESVDAVGNAKQRIITDFVPSNSAVEFRSVYQYFPTSQYRIIDLISDSPLKRFNLRCWWEDVDGVFNPLYIPWNSEIEIKLGFFKKSLFNHDLKQTVERQDWGRTHEVQYSQTGKKKKNKN